MFPSCPLSSCKQTPYNSYNPIKLSGTCALWLDSTPFKQRVSLSSQDFPSLASPLEGPDAVKSLVTSAHPSCHFVPISFMFLFPSCGCKFASEGDANGAILPFAIMHQSLTRCPMHRGQKCCSGDFVPLTFDVV